MSKIYKKYELLDANSMATGIGRKATDAELTNYLEKGHNYEPIDLEEAFFKFKSNNFNNKRR